MNWVSWQYWSYFTHLNTSAVSFYLSSELQMLHQPRFGFSGEIIWLKWSPLHIRYSSLSSSRHFTIYIIGILLNYELLYWTINLNLNLDETVNFEIISINSATAVTMSFVLQTFQLTFKSFVKQLHFNIVQMQYDSSWMI